jgi:sterol desaturase/sphingolipid hydroxylase (fatty acid hydroxylase superfamily)
VKPRAKVRPSSSRAGRDRALTRFDFFTHGVFAAPHPVMRRLRIWPFAKFQPRDFQMPRLIDVLMDPASLVVSALFGGLMVWEALSPARQLPHVKGWRAMGLAAFAVFFLLSAYLPYLWSDYLGHLRVVDLSGVGTTGGAMCAVMAYEAGAYAYHRAMHRFSALWRLLHQMHHSAERIDTFGAFWFSPFDMAGWILLSSIVFSGLLGLAPEASLLAVSFVTFLNIFQHANIRTPQWLGYLVQRPESHSWHHARGIHNNNFADLPLFDIVFGTFFNPRRFAPATGFYNGASYRVGEMLLARDVAGPANVRSAR